MKNAIVIISLLIGISGFIFALGTAGASDVGMIMEFKVLVIRMVIALSMIGVSYVGLRLTLE